MGDPLSHFQIVSHKVMGPGACKCNLLLTYHATLSIVRLVLSWPPRTQVFRLVTSLRHGGPDKGLVREPMW